MILFQIICVQVTRCEDEFKNKTGQTGKTVQVSVHCLHVC